MTNQLPAAVGAQRDPGDRHEPMSAKIECATGLMQRIALPLLAISMLAGCGASAPKQAAQPAAKPAVVVTPEARADFDAAMARMNAQEYQQGIDLLGKVIAQVPNSPAPYINRAIAHTKIGNLKPAEDDLKRALELEPGNPVANNEYGLLYRKTGRFSEARQLYESLLVKYPYYPLVHKNLGILCDLYLRDYDCALREYEAYSHATPEDKNIKIWITDVQRRLGK
jgi:Tfp pilus assembly protein PilF